jgi:quercetin dioxygenase-like cupin family protein
MFAEKCLSLLSTVNKIRIGYYLDASVEKDRPIHLIVRLVKIALSVRKEKTKMPARAFVIEPKDYAPALNIVGEHVTVLASGVATEGYEIFLQRGPEGSGPPPHSHPWDESFFVIKGQIDFGIGAESTTASPGTLVHLPAGTMHWFRFGSGGGEMLSMTSRLGASKMFADLAGEVAPVNPDLGKLAEVCARHGLKVAV